MEELPTVSVVLPNYNHGQHVGDALHAILTQTVSPLEVIVIDDASTDGSVEVIGRFADRDPRIRFYHNEQNRGVVFSSNRGAELARGDFLYFTSSDDRILPRFLAESLRLLAQYPKALICCCDQNLIDEVSGELSPKHLAVARRPEFIAPLELAERLRGLNDQIGCSGTLIHRGTLARLGYFRTELLWHSDWFMTLVIAFRHGACYLPQPLSAFRLSRGGYSSGAREWSLQRRVLDQVLGHLASPEFADVAPAFHRARVLSTFGFGIVRAALADPAHRALLWKLPYRAIVWREVKNGMIWVSPHALRRAFWALRYRWRARRLEPTGSGPATDGAAGIRTGATRGAR